MQTFDTNTFSVLHSCFFSYFKVDTEGHNFDPEGNESVWLNGKVSLYSLSQCIHILTYNDLQHYHHYIINLLR